MRVGGGTSWEGTEIWEYLLVESGKTPVAQASLCNYWYTEVQKCFLGKGFELCLQMTFKYVYICVCVCVCVCVCI